jgi:hypothetical protein
LFTSADHQTRLFALSLTALGNLPAFSQAKIVDRPSDVLCATSDKRRKVSFDTDRSLLFCVMFVIAQ